jgi:uncharacterized protein YpbB
MSGFKWTEKTSRAATLLAEGYTKEQVAAELKVAERTVYRWQADIEFSAEVDRLTLMMGVASRAERVRIAKRVIKSKISDDGKIETSKDILDWIKFAQSETDGIKLDLTKLLAAVSGNAPPVAGEGSG